MNKLMVVLSTVALTVGISGAALITASNYTNYLNPGINGISITSSGSLTTKTVGGITGIGVSGGYVSDEIDGSGEWVKFGFTPDQKVDFFTLGQLYASGNYGDVVNEQAIVLEGISGEIVTGVLSVQSNGLSAIWASGGVNTTATTISAGLEGNGGAFQVSNPFGELAMKSITFSANSNSYRGSDYTIVNLSTSNVPEPGMISLFGMGLVALSGMRFIRRRK
jgi:hypothetical protein